VTKRGIVCPAVVAMLLVPVVVRAGYQQAEPVSTYINSDGSGSASGSLVTARNTSSDSTEYIGCSAYVYSGYDPSIYCAARDATDGYLGCYSSDPKFVSLVETMTTGSLISFYADAYGNCMSLGINNFSYVGPMAP
jgi:hypothetical protein